VSYTFLLEQGEESSVESFSDIPASVLSRLNLTAGGCCSNASETESCPGSQSGTTCEPSTGDPGEEELMPSVEGFRAKILAPQAAEKVSRVIEALFGLSSQESLAKYDPNTHSLKTRQTLLFEGCTESLAILPEWGLMQIGECFQHAQSVLHMCDGECSFWPTPRASDRDNCGGSNARKRAQRLGTYVGRGQNPQLTEWLLGWPIDWSALQVLEMAKFQQWLNSHGKHFQDSKSPKGPNE
jgi:hypothetical protein